MRSDAEFAVLGKSFPELLEPGVILPKEVYAHFGLTFYVFGLVEHGLMNCALIVRVHGAVAAGRARTPAEWESEWDRQEVAVHSLTFGQLVREVEKIPEFADLASELVAVNKNRNYFAHRFFREVAEYFVSADGCKLLLVRIARTRDRVESLEKKVEARTDALLQRLKLPPLDRDRVAQMSEDMKALGAERIAAGTAEFGWEP